MKNYVIILILILISCKQNKKNSNVKKRVSKIERNKIINPYSEITLYDNFNNTLILDTLDLNRESQFTPIYIGKIKDSIRLTYKTSKIKCNYTLDIKEYRSPKEKELEIFIDTTKTIGFPMKIWEWYKTSEYRANKKSYPVFIKNLSNDTLKIGYGKFHPIITEIKDSMDIWKPVEKLYIYGCGTGLNMFYLPPKQIAITSLRQNYGNKKVEFRVKYETDIYSNEISGKY